VDVVCGGPETSQALLDLPFDFVFFTGSTKVGKAVDAQLAGRLIPRAMELGGKCPCVVNDTKSLAETVDRIATGKFFNAGQTCFSPDFVAIKEDLADRFTTQLKENLECRYGNDLASDFACQPGKAYAERIASMRDENAIVIGEDRELQLAPTLQPIEAGSKLLEEEIFGPLLPIYRYGEERELFSVLDKLHSPLALYIFSHENDFIDELVARFPSGAVCINDTMKQSSNLQLPFGGVGESGMGRYRGKWGLEQFSHKRAFTKRYLLKDVFASRPPYKGALEKMKKLIRW
jgi:aldehyde dehydrogenase (NAD+)